MSELQKAIMLDEIRKNKKLTKEEKQVRAEASERAKSQPKDEKGRFTKREIPKNELEMLEKKETRKLARHHAPSAMRILADIMYDPDVRADIRVSAAKELLNRADGRPKAATIDVEGPSLRIVVGNEGKGKKK